MRNNRSLFPPLFGEIPTGGGGGGSGNKIQLAELPEASLEYKDRIVQYIGSTTELLTNGYFYKCVEHTTTEGNAITVAYSWDNVDVMEKPTFSINYSDDEVEVGTVGNDILYRKGYTLNSLAEGNSYLAIDNSIPIKEIIKVEGSTKFASGVETQYPVPFYESSSIFINVMYEYGQLRIRNGATLKHGDGTAHIFVYYTKTT